MYIGIHAHARGRRARPAIGARRSPFSIAPRGACRAPFLCLEILLVARIEVKAGLHLLHDVDSGVAQLTRFIRIARQEPYFGHPQHAENLGSEHVGTSMLAVTEAHIRLEGIEPGILQLVRSQFFIQTDPPTLLAEVDEYPALDREARQRFGELLTAITAQRTEDVPGHAFGVHPDQRDLCIALSLREDQGKAILAVPSRKSAERNDLRRAVMLERKNCSGNVHLHSIGVAKRSIQSGRGAQTSAVRPRRRSARRDNRRAPARFPRACSSRTARTAPPARVAALRPPARNLHPRRPPRPPHPPPRTKP